MLLCSVSQYTRAFWRIKKTIYYFFIGSVKLCTSMLCGPFLPVNRILVIFQIWQIELFLSFEKINTCKLLKLEKPPRGNIPPCPLTDRRHPIAGRCCVHLVPRRWKLPPVEMEMWGALWCQGIWAPYKMRSLAHVNLGWLVWMIVVWHWVWRCFQQGYGQGTKQKRWLCRGQTQGWGSCTQLDLLMASLSIIVVIHDQSAAGWRAFPSQWNLLWLCRQSPSDIHHRCTAGWRLFQAVTISHGLAVITGTNTVCDTCRRYLLDARRVEPPSEGVKNQRDQSNISKNI